MQPFSYGTGAPAGDTPKADARVAELRHFGYCILPGILGPEELGAARTKLDAVYATQEKELGAGFLGEIGELNLARLPLCYDEWFAKLTVNPTVLGLVKALVGDYVILHLQNGILNMPKARHSQAAWHRDLPYQNWVISEPLSVNAMFCLDPFTVETGCTEVLPHSHHLARFPDADFVDRHAVPVIAEAGSVFLFDSMLFHRAGKNTSPNVRRGINHQYTVPLLKQQIDLPRSLGGRYASDPVYAQLFGYTSQPPSSVEEWRRNRHSRLKR
jgi:ectoine hydroxylase-related dioxygenase (phytanoyl-CoA dioxygenase family)